MEIIKIREHEKMADLATEWFHSKWQVPADAYRESMNQCIRQQNGVPQWYVVIEDGAIIGGAGIIDNDFHDRKDLSPNLCALYVEEKHRCKGIAGKLLDFICQDMSHMGILVLYLITDHTSFYERYGWEFLCMVQGDGEPDMTRMYVHKMSV